MISREPEADAILSKAMEGAAVPVGPELEGLLLHWMSISSVHQPGRANPVRFPFLKWALKGRAQEVLDSLEQSDSDKVGPLIDEIERIAALPYPLRNERAQNEAYEIWAWLKEELNGSLE